jgi:hypothetical protein
MTTPRKPEHADKREPLPNGYEIERHLAGYAYPANGNVGNPTPRYHWNLHLNGALVDSDSRRAPLVEEARRDAYR